MQCEICKDTNGPFEIIEYKNRCVLACEDCARKERKNVATTLRRTGYARRISRTNRRSKQRTDG